MNRARPKQIVIRVSEEEFENIKERVEKSGLKQNEFLIKATTGKEIIVIEGLKEITLELKRIGNNLNQITKAVHEGKADCSVEMRVIHGGLERIWQSLRQLTQKRI